MEDEAAAKDGAAEQPINEEQKKDVAAEHTDTLSAKDVQEMLEKERRNWQSKIDKILAEKKTEETKAMTVEQRLEQMEKDREAERLNWTRREAKAQAQIDDQLEEALLSYASNDPEKIAHGAKSIRELMDGQTAEYKRQLEELQKQVKYASPPAKGGGESGGDLKTKTEYTRAELQDSKIAKLVMERKKKGENITIT